jgi:hypothetical protein
VPAPPIVKWYPTGPLKIPVVRKDGSFWEYTYFGQIDEEGNLETQLMETRKMGPPSLEAYE